jgi:hypothetical protein
LNIQFFPIESCKVFYYVCAVLSVLGLESDRRWRMINFIDFTRGCEDGSCWFWWLSFEIMLFLGYDLKFWGYNAKHKKIEVRMQNFEVMTLNFMVIIQDWLNNLNFQYKNLKKLKFRPNDQFQFTINKCKRLITSSAYQMARNLKIHVLLPNT